MNEVQVKNKNEIAFTNDQVELIKTQIAKGCTDDELKLFMHVASKSGLDPFSRQIYAIKRKAKVDGKYTEVMSIQTGIDGFRLIAHRTERCLSISDAEFTFQGNSKVPISATTTVKKIVGNHVGEFTATAYWDDYYGDGKSYMANQKPRIMLGKVSEALALRKAFPNELSGLKSDDEMVIADSDETQVIKEEKVVESASDSMNEKKEIINWFKGEVSKLWPDLTQDERIILMNDVLKVNKIDGLIRFSISDLLTTKSRFFDFYATLT